MKRRNFLRFAPCAALLLLLAASCSTSSSGTEGDDTMATDEVAASMGSAEAGASYVAASDIAELTGVSAAKSVVSARGTVTIVAGTRTITATYYDQLDGKGTVLGTTTSPAPGTIPVGTLSAKIASTRPYTVAGARGNSTVAVDSSIVVNNPRSTTGTWSISGTIIVSRDIALANGNEVATATTHTLNYSVSASNGSIQKGGTASTTATIKVNSGRSFSRSYSWVFSGDGSAMLTTQNGSIVTVTVG